MEKFPQQNNNEQHKPKFEISHADGIEVLENFEINEKNEKFTQKMAEIEKELKSRYNTLHLNPDTGEPKKGAPTEFAEIKRDTIKETRKNLTEPSKYVKGAVITGIVAAGLYIDSTETNFLPELVSKVGDINTWVNTEIAELCAAMGVAVFTIKDTIKAISRELKTKVVSNEKVQRIVAMMAGGIEQDLAQTVVGVESNNVKAGGYVNAEKNKEVYFHGSFVEHKKEDQEVIKSVREQLDEMGIKRIDREKYGDKKPKGF